MITILFKYNQPCYSNNFIHVIQLLLAMLFNFSNKWWVELKFFLI